MWSVIYFVLPSRQTCLSLPQVPQNTNKYVCFRFLLYNRHSGLYRRHNVFKMKLFLHVGLDIMTCWVDCRVIWYSYHRFVISDAILVFYRDQFSSDLKTSGRQPIYREKSSSMQSQSIQMNGSIGSDNKKEADRNSANSDKYNRVDKPRYILH